MATDLALDEATVKRQKTKAQEREPEHADGGEMAAPGLAGLQKLVGNRAVQRLIAQRSSTGPTELDEDTAANIKQQRGAGQNLDTTFGAQAGDAMGADFGDVRVHTSPEANALTQQLGAKAFTTGQDVFFKQGAYDPHSSGGQELIAHELTHVVQQGSGAVPTGQRMAVTPPDDRFERQADATARAVIAGGTASATAQQAPDEGSLQTQPAADEEEEVPPAQTKPEHRALQRQIDEEEEGVTPAQSKSDAAGLQRQPAAEEEEELPPAQTRAEAAAVQRQIDEEEEETRPAQTKPDSIAIQKQPAAEEEEEETPPAQSKSDSIALQRQPAAEEEEEETPPAQTKSDSIALQRQPAAEEEEEETPLAQTKSDSIALQRQPAAEEEEEETPLAQTKLDSSALQLLADG